MSRMQMPMGMSRRAGGAASLSAQVQAMLSGTTGFALDPTDLSTMWAENTKVTQITGGGQTVGAIRTKWGTTQYDLIQATAGARPTFDGTRFLVPDGGDFLAFDGTMDAIRNAPAYYLAFRHGGTHNSNAFVSLSSATAGTHRLLVTLGSGGTFQENVRRAEADANSSRTTASTTVTSGSTISLMQDLAADGVGDVYRDNVFVESLTAIGGTLGNGENTASSRLVLFANMSKSFPATSSLGRLVLLPFEPSAGQRATIQSWLTEV